MSLGVERLSVERFRTWIAERFGLWYEDSKLPFLAEVLGRRSDAHAGGEAGRYLSWLLDNAPSASEVRSLAAELTVGETYFFRHAEQFRAFSEVAVPDRLLASSGSPELRILSAACASGEEAYSLSMLLREVALPPGTSVTVLGVDLNAVALEKAELGRYSPWALRETPEAYKRRYFRAEGTQFVLGRAQLWPVSFEQRNLVDPFPWMPESFDVIFCRNMLMYLTAEQNRHVVNQLTRALAPGGYLFLGHAENLRGVSNAFHLRHTHGTFYYQRKQDLLEGSERPPTALDDRNAPPFAESNARAPGSGPGASGNWLQDVQNASDRIRALSEGSLRGTGPRIGRGAADPEADLGVALGLLDSERFAEALAVIERLPIPLSTDALLLRSVLLIQSAEFAEAERNCRRLLEVDELNAGAHYLLALCHEHSGDVRAAMDEDQTAIHLDFEFAMPHLHLGLMARRAGDRESARRELGQAASLLTREDAARLALFGGGFRREALIQLCVAELGKRGLSP